MCSSAREVHGAHVRELVEVEHGQVEHNEVQAQRVAVNLLERGGHQLVHHVEADVRKEKGKDEEQELPIEDVLDDVDVAGVAGNVEDS